MNLRLSLCSAALLLFSSVGCCHMHGTVDSCNSCGGRPGCGLGRWMSGEISAWRSRNSCNCGGGWVESECGGCATCGETFSGGDCASGNCGGGMPGGGGCSSCSGGMNSGSNYAPVGGPTPIPADQAPMPTAPQVPASDAAARQMMMQGRPIVMQPGQAAQFAQPMQVSWDEFQKMPGTVVGGPNAVPAAQQQQFAQQQQQYAAPSTQQAAPMNYGVQPAGAVAPQVSQPIPAAPQTLTPPATMIPTVVPTVVAPASFVPPTAAMPTTMVTPARPIQQAAWTPLK